MAEQSDCTESTALRVAAARVRAQLQAARNAAELAERIARRWSWAIGRNVQAAAWDASQRDRWPARCGETAIGLCEQLQQLAEAGERALAAWDAGVDDNGRPRPDPAPATARPAGVAERSASGAVR